MVPSPPRLVPVSRQVRLGGELRVNFSSLDITFRRDSGTAGRRPSPSLFWVCPWGNDSFFPPKSAPATPDVALCRPHAAELESGGTEDAEGNHWAGGFRLGRLSSEDGPRRRFQKTECANCGGTLCFKMVKMLDFVLVNGVGEGRRGRDRESWAGRWNGQLSTLSTEFRPVP